jgi:hypothetical protein
MYLRLERRLLELGSLFVLSGLTALAAKLHQGQFTLNVYFVPFGHIVLALTY